MQPKCICHDWRSDSKHLHKIHHRLLHAVKLRQPMSRPKSQWWTLAAMTGSLSMILLDQTVVAVALPDIGQDLQSANANPIWVIDVYILTLAATVALGGRLGDTGGRVRTFVIGVLLFAGASVACGLAVNYPMLIAARAFQGFGAALMQPASAALVVSAFAPNQRGRAMAVYAGVSVSFLAMGPLIGGFLTQTLSWRWVFWVNLPVAAVALGLVAWVRPTEPPAQKLPIRWPSVAMLVTGMLVLTFGLQERYYLVALAGTVAMLAFVRTQWRHDEPLLAVRLFKNRAIAGEGLILFFMQGALIILTVYGAVYFQTVLHLSPVETGLAMMVLVLPSVVMAQVGGRMYDRVGVRVPASLGVGVAVAAMAGTSFMVYERSLWGLLLVQGCIGVGVGAAMTPVNTDALNRTAANLRAQTSGLIQTLRQTGGAVGVAWIGGIIEGRLASGVKPGTSIAIGYAAACMVMTISLVVALVMLPSGRIDGEA